MADTYLLHFPDGTEYGPVDRATLEAWHREGRIPKDALVWPDGAPEWLTVDAVVPEPAGSGPSPRTASPSDPTAATGPGVAKGAFPPAEPVPAPSPARSSAIPRDPIAPASPARPVSPARPARPAGPAKAAEPTRSVAPSRPAAGPSAAVHQTATPTEATLARGTDPGSRRAAVAPAPGSPGASGVRPSAPQPFEEEKSPETRPPEPAPRGLRRPRPLGELWTGRTRTLTLLAGGVVLVLVLLAGLLAVLRPFIERRRAIAAVERQALADRRVGDDNLGFVVDLPPGWVALREDNPFVVTRGARLRLANPARTAFGAVRVETDPEIKGDLDKAIDRFLQELLPSRPSQREVGRADAQLGRGRGRYARTAWDEDGQRLQGALAVWADGYDYYSLDAWAPSSVGDSFVTAFEELLRGIAPSGKLAARVDEAAERLSVEVPELPIESLRLLIGKRMAEGESLEGVSVDALHGVSRGIDAMSPAEAEEMRLIYEKIWAPVPEEQRERLARILERVKDGSPVPAPYLEALREVVKAGVRELPAEERTRLQVLSARALEQSLLLP